MQYNMLYNMNTCDIMCVKNLGGKVEVPLQPSRMEVLLVRALREPTKTGSVYSG